MSKPDAGGNGNPVPPMEGSKIGISLSGGGIRSAAFSLGVCQQLIEAGVLARAKYLSAVSGGSYIAAALAISHAECPKELQGERPVPWGRGSPEEAQLRRNLTYLAPGSRGRLWLFANLLYGLILNLTPLLVGAYLGGRATGILLGQIYPGLGSGEPVTLTALYLALGLAASLVVLSTMVVGARRFFDKERLRPRMSGRSGERWVARLLTAAGFILAAGILLPLLIGILTEISRSGGAEIGGSGIAFVPRRILVGLAIVGFSIGLGAVAVWLLRRRRLRRLRGALAYLSGLGILFAPFLLAAQTGAALGPDLAAHLWVVVGSTLILFWFAILVHNRRYSMHLFYRERLQNAFALRRLKGEDGKPEVEKIPYEESIKLSEIARKNAERKAAGGGAFPNLVMCAAVAARGAEVPNKSWAASFTFEGNVSGSKSPKLEVATEDLESGDWIGGGDVTLPAMMAISGAAVSPLMGRFTLPGFRFLMAMLNIRLGVWLRNPRYIGEEGNDGEKQGQAEEGVGLLRRGARYVLQGWREPGAFYVLKEALGQAGATGRYVYVSDGGHWENLGLTELLRRGCSDVLVIDASGDPGLGDIARAMSVARAELGVEFKLDPLPTIGGAGHLADSPVVTGTFTYPEGDECTIYYVRSVLWRDAPSDLRLFAEREPMFPNHPTSNQFLSGELFESYRALGWAVGERLLPELEGLPPERWDQEERLPEASAASG